MVVDSETRSTSSSGGKVVRAPRRASPTTSASAPSSSGSSPRSGAGSTSRRRSSTRASRTARASTPSSGRSRSAASCITIRKFAKKPLTLDKLVELRRAHRADGAASSRAASSREKNIVISGGTGSGKTTLLNVLSGAIPERRAHRHDRGRRRAPARSSRTSSRSRPARRTWRGRGSTRSATS